jgi:multiple sugar transport system substrate-binding protein
MMWGDPEELKVWQQIVDDFQATNPNIKVNVDVSDWDSYWTKLKTLYAGGTPPDVFAMERHSTDWVSRGALLVAVYRRDARPAGSVSTRSKCITRRWLWLAARL